MKFVACIFLLFNDDGLLFEGEPKVGKEQNPPEWFIDLLLPKVTPLSKQFGQGHMVIYAAPLQEINERWLDIRSIFDIRFSDLYFCWASIILGSGLVTETLGEAFRSVVRF